jgi:hypothetical protein
MIGMDSYCRVPGECGRVSRYDLVLCVKTGTLLVVWHIIHTSPIPWMGISSYTHVILISFPRDRKREWNSSCILASTSESLRRTSTSRVFVPETRPASRESRCPTTARLVPE